MKEKLSPKAAAFALAGVSGLLYLVCAILIAIAPEATIKFFGNLFHGINLETIAQQSISFSSAVVGFVEILIGSLVTGWIFAKMYNKFA